MSYRTSWAIRTAALIAAAAVVTSCTESPTERRPEGVSLFTNCTDNCEGIPQGSQPKATTTILVAEPASIAYGAPTTLAATVSSTTGTPFGEVRFYDFPAGLSCTNVGTTTPLGTVSAAPYTLETASLLPGARTISACFVSGNSTLYGNSAGTTTVTVGKVASKTALSSKVDAANPQIITFTITVSGAAPITITPTGTVSLYEFGADQSCAALNGATATASASLVAGAVEIPVTTLSVGAHTVTACYDGDDAFESSSDATNTELAPRATTTSLTSTKNPSVTGEAIAFTIKVTSDGAAVTGGVVTIKRGGVNCSDANATLLFTNTETTDFEWTGGPFYAWQDNPTIRACYDGTGTPYASSEANVVQDVRLAPTTTSLTGSPNPSTYGESVNLLANIDAATSSPQSFPAFVNQGDVLFEFLGQGGSADQPAVRRIVKYNGGKIPVGFGINTISVGTYIIRATFSGTRDFLGSIGSMTHEVKPAPLTITAPKITITAGENVPALVPTYSGFVLDENGAMSTVLTTPPECKVDNFSSSAVPGTYTITCAKAVAPNYTITYVPGTLHVRGSTTTTAITQFTSQYSDRVRVTATVTAQTPLDGIPLAGTVKFVLDGNPPVSVPVSNGVASWTTSALNAGAHSVRADFVSSNSAYTGSTTAFSWVAGPEDATITPLSTNVGAINVSQTSAALGFTVRETSPEPSPTPDPNGLAAAGAISSVSTMTARLVGVASNTSYTGSCTAGAVSGSGYSASRPFTCSFTAPAGSRFQVDAYTVEVNLGGDYYTGRAEDVLAVFDPAAGFVSGGGKFIDPADGRRVSFGMGFAYTGKGKTGYRGGWVVVKHFADGSVCRVKSNTMNPPAVSGTTAALSGKSNYACVNAAGVTTASAGNLDALGYVEDNGTSGAGQDKFWIRAFGALNMPTTAKSNAALLSGGNITVPKP